MPEETHETEIPLRRPPQPPRAAPQSAGRFWTALAVCAVIAALLGLHYHSWLLDRIRVNHLYFLGHTKRWREAYSRLGAMPSRQPADPYALRIRLEILLHLAKTGEALDLIERHRSLFDARSRDLVGLQQTAAFVYILTGQNQQALPLLRNHRRNRLSAAMARLIEASTGTAEIGPREIERLDSLIEKEMVFRGPYGDLARYLFARRYLNRGETDRAVELLEGICARYPHQAAFHYDLAAAYCEKRRFDLAGIHFAIAHIEMRRERRRVPARAAVRPLFEDETVFRKAVLEHAFRHAATRSPEDFWRFLRGLRGVLDPSSVVPLLAPDLCRPSLAAAYERSAARNEYGPAGGDAASAKAVGPLEKAFLSCAAKIARELALGARSFPIALNPGAAAGKDAPPGYILQAVTVLAEPAGLLSEGAARTYSIPAVSTGTLEGAALVKLRAFPRREISGGCGIRVGADQYWLYPNGVSWYAFALPPLPGENIEIEIEATDYAIPGYTEPGDKESRRIHVEAVVGCYLQAANRGE